VVVTVGQVPLADLVQGPIRESRPHLSADRVAYYRDHLDEAPPVTVFDIDGHLLLADCQETSWPPPVVRPRLAGAVSGS
jgi:hypothetical protein